MACYRLLCVNAEGYFEFADCIEAADDDAAIHKASYLKRDAVTSEIWEGKRLVASLDHRSEKLNSADAGQPIAVQRPA